MTRASRKRKLETIVLSDSEEERTETSLSQSTALRQPLQFSQPTRPPSVPRDNTAQPTIRKTSLQQESKLLVGSRVPKSSADLAVPKKKVGEVRDWLLADHGPSLLLLSGPSGCGKTSTIRVLAAETGAEVTEWTTPTPTLWAEYVQQRAAGISGTYSSKLDDFEDFVSHAKLDAQQRQRLADLLSSIAGVAKCRVVITATVSTSQGGQDRASAASASQGLHKELLAAINAAGAAHISFNAVTKANMDKALQQACAESGIQGTGIKTSKAQAKRGKKNKAEAAVSAATATSGSQMPSSRNKPCEVADRRKRPQLGVDPEAVLLKSGLESSLAAAFLHENMLEFVHHDAVEDAAGACSYLSDAARMLDQSSGHQPDWTDDNEFNGQALTEAAAGSTVVRGLLYSLMHPAARRFLSLKSPALFTNNKAAGLNKEQLQAMCWSAHSMTGSARVFATDNLPFTRLMNMSPGVLLHQYTVVASNGCQTSKRLVATYAGNVPNLCANCDLSSLKHKDLDI
ncbi:hypothetical protein WJX79_006444 [Trebouxia sp. C0005]